MQTFTLIEIYTAMAEYNGLALEAHEDGSLSLSDPQTIHIYHWTAGAVGQLNAWRFAEEVNRLLEERPG